MGDKCPLYRPKQLLMMLTRLKMLSKKLQKLGSFTLVANIKPGTAIYHNSFAFHLVNGNDMKMAIGAANICKLGQRFIYG